MKYASEPNWDSPLSSFFCRCFRSYNVRFVKFRPSSWKSRLFVLVTLTIGALLFYGLTITDSSYRGSLNYKKLMVPEETLNSISLEKSSSILLHGSEEEKINVDQKVSPESVIKAKRFHADHINKNEMKSSEQFNTDKMKIIETLNDQKKDSFDTYFTTTTKTIIIMIQFFFWFLFYKMDQSDKKNYREERGYFQLY